MVVKMLMCNANRRLSESADFYEEKVAMLQSIVSSTYPASMQNGSLTQPCSQHQQQQQQQPQMSISGPSASTYDICRICHCEAEVDAPLIAPCCCAGSLRYVHQACLQQWIKSSNTKKCELCKFEFIMHTKLKPLRQWERLQMTSMERRKIFCSVTFHFVAITCVVWSLYVLIDRTADEMKSGSQLEWAFYTKLIVVAIGFSGGIVFLYVQCKMYWQLCHRWKAFNRIIYVQNAPPKGAMTTSNALFPRSTSSLESTSTTTLTDVVATKQPMVEHCVVTMTTMAVPTMTTTTTMTTSSSTSASVQSDLPIVVQSAPPATENVGEHSETVTENLQVYHDENGHPSTRHEVLKDSDDSSSDDEYVESETVISGSEVTMVEPIERVP